MADKIEVKTWSLDYLGWARVDHSFILYTQNIGTPQEKVYFISGTFGGEAASFNTSIMGSIKVNHGEFVPNTFDWGKPITGSQTIAYSQDSLFGTYTSMERNALYIESLRLGYGLLGPNSNALIHTLLKNAGLPDTDQLEQQRLLYGGDLDLDELHGIETSNANHTYTPLGLENYQTNGSGYSGGRYFSSLNGGPGDRSGWDANSNFAGGRWVLVGVGVGDGPINYGYRFVPSIYWASRIPPVILDLDRDGLELIAPLSAPGFDWDGDGFREAMGWFGSGDAALIFDQNGNNVVDNGSELSLLRFSATALTDLEALSAFDTNGNGSFDHGDADWARFRLWRDTNQNGTSDPGEVHTLGAFGVYSIGLSVQPQETVSGGNVVSGSTVVQTTSGSLTAYDVAFAGSGIGMRPHAVNGQWTTLSSDVGAVIAYYSGTSGVQINSIGDFIINGSSISGLALGPGNDAVFTGYNQNNNRFFVVDSGDGNDVVSLPYSYIGSAIQGGNGDDILQGTMWHDRISAGPGQNKMVGFAGGDEYTVSRGSYGVIDDGYGPNDTDGVFFVGYSSTGVYFTKENMDVIVTAYDGSMSIRLFYQLGGVGQGVEHLLFSDRNFTAAEISAIVGPGTAPPADGGGDGGGGGGGGGGGHEPPIVLDLDGDGFELISIKNSTTHFDWDEDGLRERTGWVGPDDGFLVIDLDGDGAITRSDEISFGAQIGKREFISDLEGLLVYDTNRNGWLDVADTDFEKFHVWKDVDSDGAVDAGELKTLLDIDFGAMSLVGVETGSKIKPNENTIVATTQIYLNDGSRINVADVFVAVDQQKPDQAMENFLYVDGPPHSQGLRFSEPPHIV